MSDRDLHRRLDQASREVEQLRAENERLRTLLGLSALEPSIVTAAEAIGRRPARIANASVTSSSSNAEKVALIRSIFRGRQDVYALRWENARTGQNGYVPAVVGGWNATRGGPKMYLPLSDEAVEDHLRGKESLGIYPLLKDDTCWFLAVDLDGRTWQLDAAALVEACSDRDVHAALELSRSGDGAHVWIFFAAPVAASSARRLGALLLRDAMTRRAELDLASYDRLFPNQDFLLGRRDSGTLSRCRSRAGAVRPVRVCSSTQRRSSPHSTSGRCSASSNDYSPSGSKLSSRGTTMSRSA